jgi:hypothetical protein
LSNGKTFNEIKQKLNSGKTLKFRQRRDKEVNGIPILKEFSEFDNGFLNLVDSNGYKSEGLAPSLYVYFNRITLLNKYFLERMTLDFGLRYEFGENGFSLNNTVIVELKRDKSPERTVSQDFFRKINKEPSGFSKYCIGVCLTHEEAKKNRFLQRIKKTSFEKNILERSNLA